MERNRKWALSGEQRKTSQKEGWMNEHKIYCLDDDEAVIAAIQQVLQSYYSVLCYTDPSLCLSDAESKGCDLLITDIRMPKMDGVEMITIFRKFSPFAPVIIVTGYANVNLAKKGIQAGADEFLEKPLDRLRLLKTIEELLLGYSILKMFGGKCSLSKMEFMTLQHILANRSTKEIAHILNRSIRTMESHRYGLMKKCGVTNIMGLLTKPDILKYMKYKQKVKGIEPSSVRYPKESIKRDQKI
jgi:two-component system, LuxR family, response regulator FixJ